MILKFCFNNEIHRCTRPPTDFVSLKPFLQSMFHDNLPANFSISYLDSNNHEITISSQEDYESLLNSNQSGTLKLFVSEVQGQPNIEENMEDSEIITHHEENFDQANHPENQENSDKDDYEVLGEPLLQEEESHEASEDIQEPKKEEILSQEDVIEEVKECRDDVRNMEESVSQRDDDEGIENVVSHTMESRIYESVRSLHDVSEVQDARLREIVEETVKNQMPHIMHELEERLSRRGSIDKESQCSFYSQNNERSMISLNQPVRYVGEKPGVLDQIKEFGKAAAAHLKELPSAAMDILDEISQMIEGDPNIFFAGGRYPTSLCEKAKKLQEIFPDKSLQDLLKFMMSMPRDLTLNQTIELYIRKMEKEEKQKQEENASIKE